MKNKEAFYTLLLIMAAGITITTCTNYFLRGSLNTGTTAKTAYEQVKDGEAVPQKEDGGAALGGMSGTSEQEKQTRLPEGRKAKGLVTDGGEALGSDMQEKEDFDSGSGEDFAASGAAAGAGFAAEEAALDSEPEEIKMFAAYSMPEEGTGGEAAQAQLYDSPEMGIHSGETELPDSEVTIEAETVMISPLETNSSQGAGQAAGEVKPSYYRNRLSELDAQIQKNRDNQTSNSSNTASLTQSTAASELKLWANELNVIYDEIMERLDEKQAGELVEEERQWMKERDRLAAEAAKASLGDAQESAEYMASLAESTRLRAYELVTAYEYLLLD